MDGESSPGLASKEKNRKRQKRVKMFTFQQIKSWKKNEQIGENGRRGEQERKRASEIRKTPSAPLSKNQTP